MPTSPAKRYSSSVAAFATNDDDAQQFQQIIRDRRGKPVYSNISMSTFLDVYN
jgi:hypothetical protein